MSGPIQPNPPQDQAALTTGEGQGGGPSGPGEKITRGELRLTQRAISSCWDIDPVMRKNVLVRAHQILVSKTSTNREAMAAAKVILAADLVSLKAVEIGLRANEQENILERLDALEGGDAEELGGKDPEA